MQKKIQQLTQVSKELTTLKNKLSSQIKLSQEKDEEIRQGEGIIRKMEMQNKKL